MKPQSIPITPIQVTESWQNQMANAINDAETLCRHLKLAPDTIGISPSAARQFPVLVPRSFVERMNIADPLDPLLLQVINQAAESLPVEGYSTDPLQETHYNPHKGLIHKYKSRVLLIVSGKCAINCRYCFRREFAYSDNRPSRQQWLDVFDYIKQRPEIEEVIFSGGDPLSAPDRHLQWLTQHIENIEHIKYLRIHTRLPVVIPKRVSDDLFTLLNSTRLTSTVVLHCNHANEINDELHNAVSRLKQAGVHVLNQSVLLKSINDTLEAQVNLQHACVQIGILPYYLHLLDPVQGAAHFAVDNKRAYQLYREIKAALSGYMTPKLVTEMPGAPGKSIL